MDDLILNKNLEYVDQNSVHSETNFAQIARIKTDEVKLLRERLNVLEKRGRQRQQELKLLRQHMDTCPSQKELSFLNGNIKQKDNLPQEQLKNKTDKETNTDSSNISKDHTGNKIKSLRLIHEVSCLVKPQIIEQRKTIQSFGMPSKSLQDKFQIFSLQTKLASYQKKHFIIQQTLNQRTQEFDRQIQAMREKVATLKNVNNQLMGQVQQLEWQNARLRDEIQELCRYSDAVIEPFNQKEAIGIQTDKILLQRPNFLMRRLQQIQVFPTIKTKLRQISLTLNKRNLDIKINHNNKIYVPKRQAKMFIFSRQVHERVFNTIKLETKIDQSKITEKTLNHEKYENLKSQIERQNYSTAHFQQQISKCVQKSFVNKNQYQSLNNLGAKLSSSYQRYQSPSQQIVNRNPLVQVQSFNYNNNNEILNQVTNYSNKLAKYDQTTPINFSKKVEPERTLKSKLSLNSSAQRLKTSSFTIRQSLQPELRSSILRKNTEISTQKQSKKVSTSLSVRDLIAQKCRQSLQIR